jgi:hypothetical protein
VFAVVDRDKIHGLWKKDPPTNCMSGIAAQFRLDVAGDFDLIFLEDNVETLLALARNEEIRGKPGPDERDRVLNRAAHDSDSRNRIRAKCASFNRLVLRIAEAIKPGL